MRNADRLELYEVEVVGSEGNEKETFVEKIPVVS